MAMTQIKEVVPPTKTDKDLVDFSGIIQYNLDDLFQAAHTHSPLLSVPANADGKVGDIRILQVSSTWYLYAKVATNVWKRVALS